MDYTQVVQFFKDIDNYFCWQHPLNPRTYRDDQICWVKPREHKLQEDQSFRNYMKRYVLVLNANNPSITSGRIYTYTYTDTYYRTHHRFHLLQQDLAHLVHIGDKKEYQLVRYLYFLVK